MLKRAGNRLLESILSGADPTAAKGTTSDSFVRIVPDPDARLHRLGGILDHESHDGAVWAVAQPAKALGSVRLEIRCDSTVTEHTAA